MFSFFKKKEPSEEDLELEALRQRLKQLDAKTSRIGSAFGLLHERLDEVNTDMCNGNGSIPNGEMPNEDSVANKVQAARKSVMFMRENAGKLVQVK